MKTIEIIISPAGEARLQTRGFTGSTCQEASKIIQSALGAMESDQKTAEFHTTCGTVTQNTNRRG